MDIYQNFICSIMEKNVVSTQTKKSRNSLKNVESAQITSLIRLVLDCHGGGLVLDSHGDGFVLHFLEQQMFFPRTPE